ncbi:MAG: hypothetical protein WCG49_08920 [Actinomycetes bacterium]
MAMKISTRSSVLMLTATALLAISACGGSDSSSEAAPRTKNAALCIPQKTKDRTSTCIPMNATTVTPATSVAPATTTAPDTTATPATTAAPATTVADLAVNTADGCKTAQKVVGGIIKQLQKPNGAVIATTTTTTAKIECVPTTTIAPATTVIPTTIASATTATPTTTAATIAPATTAKKPICDVVRKKQHLC